MHNIRTGRGRPLLLVHGLGATKRAWDPVIARLALKREIIAVDLPGHGASPAAAESYSVAGLGRQLERFVESEGLRGIDMVGSSLGARLVLEMARRGIAGATVALDPGGFWAGWERSLLKTNLTSAAWMARASKAVLPWLAQSPGSRSFMLSQLSARPWELDAELVASELLEISRSMSLPFSTPSR